MHLSNSELHLRRAKTMADPRTAIAEYMLAIAEAVRELKNPRPMLRVVRRR
jgi:hypothetical protein